MIKTEVQNSVCLKLRSRKGLPIKYIDCHPFSTNSQIYRQSFDKFNFTHF